MFNKKKTNEKRRSNKKLSQYGLFDISTDISLDNNEGYDNDNNNDSDLEAELLALSGSSDTPPKKPRRKMTPRLDLDTMVADSMKDVPSDEELSGDDDDPALLNELNELTHPSNDNNEALSTTVAESGNVNTLLLQRLKMYEIAEMNAKEAGENSRVRRFGRGIKTLQELIKQSKAGKPINNDDIPPEVSVNVKKKEDLVPVNESENDLPLVQPAYPSRKAPPPPHIENLKISLSTEQKELLNVLNERKMQYKSAAVAAKKSGDTVTAINYVKIVKQFELVIKAVESGQEVDLSGMPGPPEIADVKIAENSVQMQEDKLVQSEEEISESTLITASSVAEALEQRLQIYKQQEQTSKEGGNSSKARRMGRIVKQYEQAIKLNNAGKPIPVDELPTPPGYAPIPVPGIVSSAPQPAELPPANIETPASTNKVPQSKPPVSRISGNHAPTTRAEKQVQFLLARQKEFKIAALNAKKKGELEQAKEFLRTAKGFEPLLEASYAGLPVDIASLPVPPSARSHLDNEYELVMAEECTEEDTDLDVLSRLETQLTKQLKMCLSTRDHNKAIGDVAGTNRFENLALNVTRDLDLVRLARRTPGSPIPKFHYEQKEFSVVKTLTELNDNDLELTIVRGINYNCSNPKDIDTYVKFEFPYPQEEPVKDRTSTVKDTNNPEYNYTFTLPIQRTARTCLRVFKRHSVKFEIYSKGGFLRSDTLLGTVSVKLQPLETQCEIHDSYYLMDGRKKVGGKLEVKMRVRNPLLNKQVEQLSEKWLVLDH
ncbi:C2 domain containing protein [Oryctes borbonicus]|uniref:Coiled-coil and C2 domain-containing protein 1-like n=1 Tax=Oryctes borbonicus TaxID=1629725 RepID=A0A0T6B0P3_9SCAR|nr:C2 domain containing protein [Oryctes borbonicus]